MTASHRTHLTARLAAGSTRGRVAHRRASQRGAVAIETAGMFMVFFMVFYGLVSYSFVMLVQQGLSQAAAQGARAALRVDPLSFTAPGFSAQAQNMAKAEALAAVTSALSWAPQKVMAHLQDPAAITVSLTPQTVALNTGGSAPPQLVTTTVITVKVRYLGYATDPVIPALSIGGLAFPSLPTNLVGSATL